MSAGRLEAICHKLVGFIIEVKNEVKRVGLLANWKSSDQPAVRRTKSVKSVSCSFDFERKASLSNVRLSKRKAILPNLRIVYRTLVCRTFG